MKKKNLIVEKAINHFGSQSKLARMVGAKQQNIHWWLYSRVPAEFVLIIEKATNGLVTRHELRPDLYPIEEA